MSVPIPDTGLGVSTSPVIKAEICSRYASHLDRNKLFRQPETDRAKSVRLCRQHRDLALENYVTTAQNALQCDNCGHSCVPFSVKKQSAGKSPSLLLIGLGVETPGGGRVFAEKQKNKALSLSARESAHVATTGLACTLQHFQSQCQCVSVTVMTKKILAGPTWTFYGFS